MKLQCVKLHSCAEDLFRSTSGSAGFDVSICTLREEDKIRAFNRDGNCRELENYPKLSYIRSIESMDTYMKPIFSIEPGKSAIIHTGLSVAIPDGYVGLLCARSGISNHYGITPKDCIGVIDSDYRGELMVHLVNNSDKEYFLSYNERICQLLIIPYLAPEVEYVKKLNETERGIKGFGSTGVN